MLRRTPASVRSLLGVRLREQVQIEGVRLDRTRTLLVVASRPEGERAVEREVLTEAEARRLIGRGLADPIPAVRAAGAADAASLPERKPPPRRPCAH